MLLIPSSFLYGKAYFFETNERRPSSKISHDANSIWKAPPRRGTNGTYKAVTHNGTDVFVYIYCKHCKKWQTREDGGHTGSHHQAFVDGRECLPFNHAAMIAIHNIMAEAGNDIVLRLNGNAAPPQANNEPVELLAHGVDDEDAPQDVPAEVQIVVEAAVLPPPPGPLFNHPPHPPVNQVNIPPPAASAASNGVGVACRDYPQRNNRGIIDHFIPEMNPVRKRAVKRGRTSPTGVVENVNHDDDNNDDDDDGDSSESSMENEFIL